MDIGPYFPCSGSASSTTSTLSFEPSRPLNVSTGSNEADILLWMLPSPFFSSKRLCYIHANITTPEAKYYGEDSTYVLRPLTCTTACYYDWLRSITTKLYLSKRTLFSFHFYRQDCLLALWFYISPYNASFRLTHPSLVLYPERRRQWKQRVIFAS
jgi:hypothetical protein